MRAVVTSCIPKHSYHLTLLHVLLTVAAAVVLLSENGAAQNRLGYLPGDWVTYRQTRFVTSVGMGWNDMYFGTTGGVIRYNSLDKRWKEPLNRTSGLQSDEIWRIAVNPSDDMLWVETPLGVYSYNPLFQEWATEFDFPTQYEHSDIRRFTDIQTYHLDVGWSMSYDGEAPFLTDPQLREYQVLDALEDRWNHLWLATYGNGIADVDLSSRFVTLHPVGLYQNEVEAMLVDGDSVWFGSKRGVTSDNAITLWDRDSDLWQYFDDVYDAWLVSDEVNDIAADDRYVFFATDGGLAKLDKKDGSLRSFGKALGLRSDEIYSLYIEDSLLFMGGTGTIDVMLIRRDSVFPLRAAIAPFGKVLCINHIGGSFWIGTDNGLYRYNLSDKRWSRFDVPEGYLGGDIWQILPGRSGEIWFAGIDGVARLDSSLVEKEAFLTRRDLNEHAPHRIALAGDFLWIGTEAGVQRYDRVKRLWKFYSTYDGLVNNYINDMKVEGDYLWFATPEGVTSFYWNNPLRIRDE
jgi:ligand-binding sensor domain-containing protein